MTVVEKNPWDEADFKVKTLVYLSLGAEAGRTFRPSSLHTKTDRCSTKELVHEISLTFKRPGAITFDRFLLFKANQQFNKNLEPLHSRFREAGSHCWFYNLEKDNIKDFFISNTSNTNMQMDLLSVLNYSVN